MFKELIRRFFAPVVRAGIPAIGTFQLEARSRMKTASMLLALLVLAPAGLSACAPLGAPVTIGQTQAASAAYSTKEVREGSISIETSGTVTLVPGQETGLPFTVSGTVAALNVAAGDRVKKGDLLAQLDNLPSLEADIRTARQELASAEQALAAFKAKAPADLANGQLAVIEAQQALEEAQGRAVTKNDARCDDQKKASLLDRYNKAVKALDALGDGGGSADYYLNRILPQKKAVDQALGAYQACQGFTDYQVASSQGAVVLAKAKLAAAENTLADLTKNNGLDPAALSTAENTVASAQSSLSAAQDNLAGASLIAPYDGTVLSVAGKAGDTIEVTSSSTPAAFITVADLDHPVLSFNVDETDLSLVARGEAARVIFDAFSDRVFHGTVTRVDPTVGSNNGVSAVTGRITLDLSGETDVPAFPKNLSGSAQIIQAEAVNTLIIPVEALHQQAGGTTGVYVLGADGTPQWRTVTTGLSNIASVEVKSGLEAGEKVITSAVQ